MPLPPGLQDQAVNRIAASILAAVVLSGAVGGAPHAQAGAAFFIRGLADPAERREARSALLDTPVLPGSVIKVVTLAAALESQAIAPDTSHLCRRVVTVNGTRYTCTHPDLKRPLSAAEALAYSCNDFFVSLAPRLSRAAFNRTRLALGLPPVAGDVDLAASFVGLAGPRLTPRALLDVVARLAGVEPARPLALAAATRAVVREGLRGAADYGTAAALGAAKIPALAKTGTAPMPGGAWMGLVVALEPADAPTRALVVVAPGAAGLDAAAVAADLLRTPHATSSPRAAGAEPPAAAIAPVRVSINGRTTTLPIEDYVARVVAGEGQPKAADAAQQALAITARTFALANLRRHRREGYDLCDTTHCQVVRPATAASTRAAQATAGRILTHNGQPATVFYSALCGGHSEMASEVWPGAVDYSGSHADDACREEPGWASEVRAADVEKALRAAGHRGDRLRDLRVLQRNTSGRVTRVRVDGFTPAEISGHELRMAVGRIAGWQQMKSTAFEVQRSGAGYRFTGRGFGHGVGLCVVGAGNRAARGGTADEILNFYYPTLRVSRYAPRVSTTVAAGAGAKPPAPGRQTAKGATSGTAARAPAAASSAVTPPVTPAAPADVEVALPAAEETLRADLLRAVRAARDDIAARAGVTAPASIRVTVHPTVDAFARATGQPWWVSGASDGRSIDLLPLTVLRQRGIDQRTVRHEVAHVLLDSALADRPLWVREGAAFYFAAPAEERDTPARVPCPRDEEFLRPVSAGTHRSAYARAEACFRRAVAETRDWRKVR